MSTFKSSVSFSKVPKRKYDENQYLAPAEYHSYSAVDSDTQYYMDDGLSSLNRYKHVDDELSNNYVEVMDELDEFVDSTASNSTSRSSDLTSSCMAKRHARPNFEPIDPNENLKAKKILQRI